MRDNTAIALLPARVACDIKITHQARLCGPISGLPLRDVLLILIVALLRNPVETYMQWGGSSEPFQRLLA